MPGKVAGGAATLPDPPPPPRPPPTSLKGHFTSSSLRIQCFRRFLVVRCSTIVSRASSLRNFLMNRGSHNSLAMPRSLQHRIRALDLQPSVAVGMPSGSKYCCSPRATEMRLRGMGQGYDSWHIRIKRSLPPSTDESVLSRHHLPCDDRLAPRSQSPASGSKRLVQYPSVLDLW